jgi:hypothetical protein
MIEKAKKPAGWKSPFAAPLYQVLVEPTDGGPPMFVGPAVSRDVAEELCSVIKTMIRKGFEKTWANPEVKQVKLASTLITQ